MPLTMAAKLLERDAEVLAAVGRFRMLTRQQVKRWFFPYVSEPVVTRFLQRTSTSGHLGVERLGGNGIQVLWLTRKGRDALVARGVPAADLFHATGPAAAKDLQHTVAIGDVAVWLSLRTPPPDELLPAWAVARLFGGRLVVVPDLLALWRPSESRQASALAIEVDLGTEPLGSIFIPKVHALAVHLRTWMPDAFMTILVLVPSARRLNSVRVLLGDLTSRVAVEVLDSVKTDVKSS